MAGAIKISVIADAGKAVRGLDTVEGKLGRVGKTAGKVGKGLAIGLGVGLGAAAVGAFKLAKGAAADEAAAARLAKVLKNATGATDKQVAATESWITAQGKALGVADDDLRPAISRLAAVTKDTDKAQRLASLAMDISAGSGKSLTAVSTALAKAQTGSVGGLSKLGVATKDASGETRSLKAITADLAKTYKGSAADAADTTAGRYGRLQLQLSELGETIGGKLLPIGNALAGWALDTLIPALSKVGGYAGTFGPVLAKVGDVIAQVMDQGRAAIDALLPTVVSLATQVATTLVPVFTTYANTITTTLVPAILAVAGYLTTNLVPIIRTIATVVVTQVLPVLASLATFVVGTLVPAVVKIATQVGTALKPILDQLFATIRTKVLPAVVQIVAKFRQWQPTIQAVVLVVLKVVGFLLKLSATILGKVLPPVIRLAGFLLGKLVPAVLGVIGVLVTIVSHLITTGKQVAGLGRAFGAFATKVDAKVREVLNIVKGIPGKVLSAVGDLSETLRNAGRQIIEGLIKGIGDKFDDLKDTLGGVTKFIPKHKGPPAKDKVLLRGAGRLIMGGLITGLEDRERDLARTLDRVTTTLAGTGTSVLTSGGTLRVTGSTRTRVSTEALTAPAHRRLTLELTSEQVHDLERGRKLAADLRAFTRAGGAL